MIASTPITDVLSRWEDGKDVSGMLVEGPKFEFALRCMSELEPPIETPPGQNFSAGRVIARPIDASFAPLPG